MDMPEIVGMAKSFGCGKNSTVVVLPKLLKVRQGQRFVVLQRENGDIIYRKLKDMETRKK